MDPGVPRVPVRRRGEAVVSKAQGRVHMAQDAKQYSSTFPVLRAQEGQADEQPGPDHRVSDVGQQAQLARTVRLHFEVSQDVEVLSRQVLQAGAEEAQLQRLAHMEQPTHELNSLGRVQVQAEPLEHSLLIQQGTPQLPRGVLCYAGIRLIHRAGVMKTGVAVVLLVFGRLVASFLRRSHGQPHLKHYRLCGNDGKATIRDGDASFVPFTGACRHRTDQTVSCNIFFYLLLFSPLVITVTLGVMAVVYSIAVACALVSCQSQEAPAHRPI